MSVAASVAVFGFLLLSLLVAYRMRAQVNARLEPSQRVPRWMHYWRYRRMAQLHRQFYPASWLRWAALACLLGFLVAIGLAIIEAAA